MSGTFPPTGPTSVQQILPAYLYQQYADDESLQAFFAAFNAMSQEYLDWFNSVNLPIYTGPSVSGALLDWVAAGLYGFLRPTLPSGMSQTIGLFNTYHFNQLPFNKRILIGSSDYYATSDDVFRRILTWHLFKGDGKVFDMRWLKRRIMQFLTGINGVPINPDVTYQVSITFGTGSQVNIRLLSGLRTVTGGALFNRFGFNQPVPFDILTTIYTSYTPLPNAAIFKAAVNAGVLELPEEFTWVVSIV